jgi:hypothetical protein
MMIMRRPILWALFVLMMTIAAVATYVVSKTTTCNEIATNGAFRDGIYLGALDAKYGKAPHIALGRWSRDSDRRSFAAGYETAYRESRAVLSQNKQSNPNTSGAYRDGLYLGKRDAAQNRPEQTVTGRWTQLQDKELFASGYHQAYLSEAARLSAPGQTVRVSMVR